MATYFKLYNENPNERQIKQIVDILRDGGVIIYPTDTVYGFGCDITNQKCTLYVTVEPCAMCCGASYWEQLGKIVYGASDVKRGVSELHDKILHPKTVVVGGVLKEKCEALMQEFFKGKR